MASDMTSMGVAEEFPGDARADAGGVVVVLVCHVPMRVGRHLASTYDLVRLYHMAYSAVGRDAHIS